MFSNIQTQVCILQTALDLLERNYEVHIVADGVSSRTMVERMFAIEVLLSMHSLFMSYCFGLFLPKNTFSHTYLIHFLDIPSYALSRIWVKVKSKSWQSVRQTMFEWTLCWFFDWCLSKKCLGACTSMNIIIIFVRQRWHMTLANN